jgi:arylsulfatase A-like enzyme/Flp pilus assembly protein TadD
MNVFMKTRNTKIILAIIGLAIAITSVMTYRHFRSSSRRRVIIISMDTTRADYLSCYGYEHKTTPNIDAVAAEAVRFEQVIAPIPLTLPSHSTMMTGTIPPYHGIHDNLNYTLGDSNVTLAEILQARGYTTGGIISTYVLEDTFGLDQGFDTYDDEFDETITDAAGAQRRGGEVSEHAIRWLDENRDEDFFLFLHYYDPHSPYDPPDAYKGLFVSKASTDDMDEKVKLSYAEEIAYTDHCIGQVVEKLKSLGLYDSTLLIITGDHGEAFKEHREMGHGYFIYQPSVQVPLIVKLPGQQKAKTVSGVAGLVDLTPTVCSLLDIEMPEHIQGRDVSGALFDEPSENEDHYIYSESLLATKYKATPLLAVTGNRFKYIQTARPELYDLIEDPTESRNLVDEQPQRARILQDVLGVMLEESLVADTTESKLELDDESLKKLESLGYVGGALEEDFSFDQDKADPKDTFQYHVDLMEIMGLMRTKDYDAAKKACQSFISKGLEVPQVYSHLAQIAMEREDDKEAIGYLRKAIALEPGTASAQAQLGSLLLTAEDYEQALIHLQEAYQIQPKSAKICYDVARAYYNLGNKEKAVEYCRKSLAEQPDYIEPRTNLGKALFELGDTPSAINEYYTVLEYDAENLNALNFLAWIQATSQDGQLRKPQEALQLAQRAAKAADYKTAEVMDTLAVAYAAAGNFSQAVTEADKAIALAESSGDTALAQRIARRRNLFKNGQTYNE